MARAAEEVLRGTGDGFVALVVGSPSALVVFQPVIHSSGDRLRVIVLLCILFRFSRPPVDLPVDCSVVVLSL